MRHLIESRFLNAWCISVVQLNSWKNLNSVNEIFYRLSFQLQKPTEIISETTILLQQCWNWNTIIYTLIYNIFYSFGLYLLIILKNNNHFSTHNSKQCKVTIVPNWHPVGKITILFCGKTAHYAVSTIASISKVFLEILHIKSVSMHTYLSSFV